MVLPVAGPEPLAPPWDPDGEAASAAARDRVRATAMAFTLALGIGTPFLNPSSAARLPSPVTYDVDSGRMAAQYVNSSKNTTYLSTWSSWQYFTVRS